MKILVLDNYDSFTYNLVHLLEKCSNVEVDVFKNDAIQISQINQYHKILLSPGPGLPSEAGIMPELIKKYHASKPIFGVCLGMQAIGEFFGAALRNLDDVVHGQKTPIKVLQNNSLFKNCPSTFYVGRYHSWVIDEHTIPDELSITAVDETENIMAIVHKTLPIGGVQFHPESILSEYGQQIIENWINDF